jgi:hypothetical protein
MTTTTKTNITTKRFLDEIHGPTTPVYFNIGNKTWQTPKVFDDNLHSTFTWLNKHKNKDICYIPNSGGTKNCTITKINSVFIDWDSGRDKNDIYFPLSIISQKKKLFISKLNKAPLLPSHTIETRNGYQCYWLLHSGATNKEFTDAQQLLAHYFSSDKSITNPARVMRLPGYNWIKPNSNCKPFHVNIINFNSIKYYIRSIFSSFKAVSFNLRTKKPNISDTIKLNNIGKKGFWTHYNRVKKNTPIIVGPKTPTDIENVNLNSKYEVVEYLKTKDLKDYLEIYNNNENNICCPFHSDTTPSASIFIKDNHQLLKCYSNNCSFNSGSIIEIVKYRDKVDEEEAIKILTEHYNIKTNYSWIEKQKEIIAENIRKINNIENNKNKYQYLYNCIRRIKCDLVSKLEFAKELITLQSVSGKALFFCSLREFERISKKSLYRDSHNGQNLKVDRYCLLGLLEKVDKEELPKELWKNTLETKKYENHIQFYSVPEYTEELLNSANETARTFKECGIRMNAISKDTVLQMFGEEKAHEIYPQTIASEFSEGSKKFMNAVEAVLLLDLRTSGYSKVNDIVEEMQRKYSWKTVTDRRVKKYIPALLVKHSLVEKVVNKEMKGKLGICGSGYPKVIVRKEVV